MRQQPALDIQLCAARVTRKSAQPAFTDYTVAGNDDRDRVRSTGLTDGLRT